MFSVFDVINAFYPADNALRRLLLFHSWQVARCALAVSRRHPELALDNRLLFEGAMAHDIGIVFCHAPGIHCEGALHYLLHGQKGGDVMRRMGREDLARICERHTGTGLRPADFEREGLLVPDLELRPQTLEEQVICYADKFYSKSSPLRVKTAEQVVASMQCFGEEGVQVLLRWHERFG